VPSSELSDSELRGWAARQMVAEDARWAIDVVLSGSQAPGISSFVPLVLGHHFVRIAYEGTVAIRSTNGDVGIPELAGLLRDQFASVTARARHATKLLDDTKKSYEAVLEEFQEIIQEHRDQLMGNGVRWARWLETDLGLYVADGRLLGATVPAAYRLGLSITAQGAISGHDVHAVSEEWGATLTVLGAASFDATPQAATLDLSKVPAVVGHDRRSDRYLQRRFETEFPEGLKMLLLAIEGDINTLASIASHTTEGHEAAVFRARTVTLYHCLSALRRVAERHSHVDSLSMKALRELMDGSAAQQLTSQQGRMVRNRCMHYEISDPRVNIDPTLPMCGIVESVFPGTTFLEFSSDVATVSVAVAQLLENWKPMAARR
jgi:hypothetical protein